MRRQFPYFAPIAEHSLLVEFGEQIDPSVHERVLALDAALSAAPFLGFREAVPAYACLMICFDPQATDHLAVKAYAKALLSQPLAPRSRTPREVEVCYDADLSSDLAHVAKTTGLSTEAVIAAHLAGLYEVYMYGFAPGYAYLAGVPRPLWMPRKPAAVRGVHAGSVLIAGPQCLVSTLTMPTGWWIIGRSPTRILTRDPDRPFLFDVGDPVCFRRVSRADFDANRHE